jgi:hypothetical protein
LKRKNLLLFLGSALAMFAGTRNASAQSQARPLVTQTIDESQVVRLSGSVHPLAQARYDRGAVADSFAAERVLLLLGRPAEREAALQQFLSDVHRTGSASFHQWLTPVEFGQRFGAADSDVRAAQSWLTSEGFTVARVTKSRQYIEFSGSAEQLRKAFRTEIHQYSVGGEAHYANANEVSVPAALAPLVRGVSPLNNFRAKPQLYVLGTAAYTLATSKTTPQWTLPNGKTNIYAVAPEDFATQYDLAPLYQAGVNGTGQTVGVINESNVDLSLVNAYQNLFSLTSPIPQVVIDGTDPGTVAAVSPEAYLDIEMVGAVAPGSTVNLYVSGGSLIQDPLYLAALRAVEDNQASVLSVSFSNCEGFLGQAGNMLWSGLWEQAAAQGQTVLVSTGDSGSAACDDGDDQFQVAMGLAVNGLASTPWNVAVGGTDFYYSDFATGGASAAMLWNQTNDSSRGSLKAPLPEQVWDTAFGFNTTGPYVFSQSVSIPAGGGGASGCIDPILAQSGNIPFFCDPITGYPKPSWQKGPGVPSDGVRDIPDVSLFAANGTNWSAYPICANPGDCVANSSGQGTITLVGGTSASTPAMAGIMALVDQKYGRQGQANFTLYPLAQQKPGVFHDITRGTNNVPCEQGTTNCSLDTNGDGLYSLQEYPAGPGYDLASGLGSVDANVLVNSWNSVSFQPTTSTLFITPASVTHGAPINFTVDVKPSSGSGTPKGNVSMQTNSSAPLSQGVGTLTIGSNGSATGTLSDLPGGTYQVWAEYAGDGTFAGSESELQQVAVAPASGMLSLSAYRIGQTFFDPTTACRSILPPFSGLPPGAAPIANGTSITPNLPIVLNAESLPDATGTVTFTLDGQAVATTALNAGGTTTWVPPAVVDGGSHILGASYSGDASYTSSPAPPFSYVVSQALTDMTVWPAGVCTQSPLGSDPDVINCTFSAGDNLVVEVRLEAYSCQYPTGTVTVNLGPLSQNVSLSPGGMGRSGQTELQGQAVFQNLAAGSYALSASYAGDANSQAATTVGTLFGATTVVATAPPGPLLPTTITVSANPPFLTYDGPFTGTYTLFSATVTGGNGATIPPTGTVTVFNDGEAVSFISLSASGATSAAGTAQGPSPAEAFDYGVNQITAVYSGDSVYKSSTNAASTFSYIVPETPDFTFTPQVPQITVQAGSSGTLGLSMTSLDGFNGVVTLTCATSSSNISCGVNPSTPVLNGAATATLKISPSANAGAQAAQLGTRPVGRLSLLATGSGLAFASVLLLGFANRKRRISKLLNVCLMGALFAGLCVVDGCGGGGSQIVQPPASPPPTPAPSTAGVTYTVVVSATANGIIHNVKISVVVP